MKTIIKLFLPLLSVISCNPPSNTNLEANYPHHTLKYHSTDSINSPTIIANPSSGEIIVISKKASATPPSFSNKNGFHSAYTSIDSLSETSTAYHFYPITDQKLFYATGLKGDLPISFTMNCNRKEINYRLSDTQYNKYIHEHGSNGEIKLFNLTNEDITGNEINKDGFNIRFQSYLFKDTLHIKVKAVNHSRNKVTIASPLINQSQFQLTSSFDTDTLPPSSRLIHHFKYISNSELSSFEASPNFINLLDVADRDKKIFTKNLSFTAN